MRRLGCLVLVGLLWLGSGTGWALVDIGQHCWSTNFADTLRVWAVRADGGQLMISLPTVAWRGLNAYQLVGTGAVVRNVQDGTPITALRLSATLGQSTPDFFGGNPTCTLIAILDVATTSGTSTMTCSGTATPFTVACPPTTGCTLTYQGECSAIPTGASISEDAEDRPLAGD